MLQEDIDRYSDFQTLLSSKQVGPCLVENKKQRSLYIFNHLEYDATTLGDEYQRDVSAGLKTALPENYYPNDDPTLPPINNWRPLAFLLMANWVNDLYQATPFDLTSLAKK